MSHLNGKTAAPIKYVAYVDIVAVQEGKRADDRVRLTVKGRTEQEAAERARGLLDTHIESLEG